MNKILIVAYYFPPIQSGGVYRPLKFVKYLRRYGWEPIVLTIDPVCGHQLDKGLLQDFPEGLFIKRTPQLDFYRLIRLFKRTIGAGKKGETTSIEAREGEQWSSGRTSELTTYLSKIKSELSVFTKNVFFIPDSEIPWLPIGVTWTLKLIKEKKIDVLMTTSPPQSAHLVGLLVKLFTGIPWIVDFRDLWIDTFDFYEKPFGRWRKPVEKWFEKAVVERADRIINISHGESYCLQKNYGKVSPKIFRVIHNGFDTADFSMNAESGGPFNGQADDKLTITYVGTLYPTTADEFFAALDSFFSKNSAQKIHVTFRFIGHFDTGYEKVVKKSSYRDVIQIVGIKPHDEAIREMCIADVLLLLQGGEKMKHSEIPGKLFEYMGASKPILAMVKDGDVSAILGKSNLGLVVNPKDRDGFEKLLHDLIELKKTGHLETKPNEDYIKTFSREGLTEKLAQLLDEIDPNKT
ncbi:putative Group 1 glycosyl transferase [uncultured Desulfobacterium sp.]|uniref:Putative Group 1 glycosyl transferase n=1 Tax=uncultured Desulfobacterium sp. TaxID=201089 RepID=A0A445MZV3_9BACT|nr:putative Group 1 glycosyl transferase [uncultured Desulfobacterium sp.]